MAKMSNKKFLGLWCPFLAASAALIIGVECTIPHVATILDTYVNHGDMIKTKAEGTENWDTNYYSQTYATATDAGGSTAALAAGKELVEDIADEGMVLLKNKDNALPISTDKQITLLGRGAVDPVYGGSGSGNVDTTTCATPYSALTKAGYRINADAYNWFNSNYSKYDRQAIQMDKYDNSTFFIGEIPTSAYGFNPTSSDVAVVFISRCGGEGLDLSTDLKRDSQTTASQAKITANANTAAEVANYVDGQHELELSKEEKDMISFAKNNYSKVVVVLNESTTMEIGSLKNDDGIDGIIWAGSPGQTGFNALGSILAGKVNPSGKTPDLYSADFTADPTFANFAINSVNEYTGSYESSILAGDSNTTKAHFVAYEEGIYVGYRYYETAAAEGSLNYNEAVVYPFGYGLSYTTFAKELVSHEVNDTNVKLKVKVTNTGSVAGKEVVQAYYSAPYTKGGIEKASTVLGDFAKTKLLAPNESEEVTLSIAIEDMASYDYKNEKAYVLDAGTYTVQVKENSHEVTKDTKGNELSFTFDRNKKVYKGNDHRPSDKTEVTNQFDDISAYFDSTGTTLSRANFATTFPQGATAAEADADNITLNGKTITQLLAAYQNVNNDSDVMPTMGENNGLTLIDLRGKDYDDEAYDQLLNQLTEEDYKNAAAYISNNAYNTPAIESIVKPKTEDHDGPQGFSTLFGKLNNVTAYTSEPLLASTYNKSLAKAMGTMVGEEALAMNPLYSGWYGPAMNTHRSPFAGRNFEYYSEDGVLAGKIAAEVVSGAADKGVFAYIKHFALNDQETWRTAGLCTWANEQAIREIYLKPFEIVVKNAKTTIKYIADAEGNTATKEMNASTAVMSSFNRIGTTWAGGSKALMTNVLRNEWGFRGVAISDFNLYTYMSSDQGMRAGTDMQLTWNKAYQDTESATARIAIRTALHNLLYTIANSNAMQGVAPGTIITYTMSPWRIWFIVLDVVLGLFVVCGTTWVIFRVRNHKDEEANN